MGSEIAVASREPWSVRPLGHNQAVWSGIDPLSSNQWHGADRGL